MEKRGDWLPGIGCCLQLAVERLVSAWLNASGKLQRDLLPSAPVPYTSILINREGRADRIP
jgi:hypothetical protein